MQCTAMHCTASLIDQVNKFPRTCIPTPCMTFTLPCSRNEKIDCGRAYISRFQSTGWDCEASRIPSLHARLGEAEKTHPARRGKVVIRGRINQEIDHASGNRGLEDCGESRGYNHNAPSDQFAIGMHAMHESSQGISLVDWQRYFQRSDARFAMWRWMRRNFVKSMSATSDIVLCTDFPLSLSPPSSSSSPWLHFSSTGRSGRFGSK